MKGIDFRSFDWDDTELKKAYDRVLEARKANKKGSQPIENKWRKWKVGDYCRAIYSADESYYEAKVISLNGDFCTVEFLGFGDTEDVDLLELKESEGENAQKKQIKASMTDSSDHNSSIVWKVGDYCRAIYSADESYYEAKIISLNGDSCTVEFLGYGDTEDVDLLELKESEGEKAQKKQIKASMSESFDHNSSIDWKVGDYCRAIYSADKSYYEAKVISLNGDFCTVEFLGYGNTEDVDLLELKESEGKKAQKKQIKASMADSFHHNSYIHTTMSFVAPPVTMPQHPVPPAPPMPQYPVHPAPPMPQYSVHPAPPMPQYPVHPAKPMPLYSVPPAPPMPQCPSLASNPSFSSMLSAWYTAGYYTGINSTSMSFFAPPVTMPQYPVPPAPPMPQCPSLANNSSFSSMLSAWYTAGYYTGINLAQKKNRGCQRCCRHSNQCCRNK